MNSKLKSRLSISIAGLALVALACTCSLGGLTPDTPVQPAPLPAATDVSIPTKPPILGNGDLQVVNTAAVANDYGGWRLMGEVSNDTSADVNGVSLKIEWFDSAGTSLGSDTGYVLTTNIGTGETAPFAYTIYDSDVALASFTASIAEFTSTQDVQRAVLDVAAPTFFVDSFGTFHCVGEITNNTGSPVDIDGLAAAVHDASGSLFSAASYWAVMRHLEPGQKTPFRISPEGLTGAVASDYTCAVFVDAQTTESTPDNGVAFKDTNGDGDAGNDIYYYIDGYGSTHLVGEIVNGGSDTMNVQMIGGLYDASGNTVDADYASPAVALAPGEALPYDFTTFLSPDVKPDVSTFTAYVDPYWTYAAYSQTVPLRVDNLSSQNDNGTFTVTADVVNDQTFNLDYAYAIGTVTDATGKVVGYNYTPTSALTSGAKETVNFTIYADPSLDPATLQVNMIARASKP
ncbi:MAG: FxLYD domain-containing protein [Chloroflexota bacterium]